MVPGKFDEQANEKQKVCVGFKMRLNIFLLLFINFSCQKFENFPEVFANESRTLLLAHRGGGDSLYPENSFVAAQNGLKILDGIELDIQISADGTLWMAHDAYLPDCEIGKFNCFSRHSDQEISDLSDCHGNDFTPGQLEEVFEIVAQDHPDDIISLDVKPWFPCSLGDVFVHAKLKELADELASLARRHQLENQIFVESESVTFLKYVKELNPEIECHILAFSDLEKAGLEALRNGLDGVSYKFDPDEEIDPEPLKAKGLTIQFWTVNTQEGLQKAIALRPHTIQTDNLQLPSFMP